MKSILCGALLGLATASAHAQGTVVFNNIDPVLPGGVFPAGETTTIALINQIDAGAPLPPIPIFNGGSGSPTYFTGGTPPVITPDGSVGDMRNRSFSGSSYFDSAGSGVDTSFSLRLGNGVDPSKAASFGGVTIAPEPSSLAVGFFGLLGGLAFLRKRRA